MDADTRHQLKQNELAEALGRLRDLRDPRFLAALAVLVVVVLAILGWKAWNYSQRLTLQQASQQLGALQEALESQDAARIARARDDLRALIDSTRNADMAAAARLLLARSRYDEAMSSAAQRPAGFEEAATQLEKLIAQPAVSPMLRAAATYLLANTYESLRRVDAAKELWQQLAREALYAGTPYQSLAEEKLLSIDELSAPVAFLPGSPPPPPPPDTQPGTKIKLTPGESVLLQPNMPPVVVPSEPPLPPGEENPSAPGAGETPPAEPAGASSSPEGPPATQPAP